MSKDHDNQGEHHDIQFKTPTAPTGSEDPDRGWWLFVAGFEPLALLVTFHLYDFYHFVPLSLAVMTGIGFAGLRKMGQLSTGTGLKFGAYTFFTVQLGAILGARHIGVETGPFTLSFGWWFWLALGTFVTYSTLKGYMFGTGTSTYVDADELIDEIKRRR